MIRKIYSELVPHVPGAVSPMIAAGRVVKELYPDAMTVFVGPCMAKKKEATEEDIADAVEHFRRYLTQQMNLQSASS